MAGTPIAARNQEDPTYSEGYLSHQSPNSVDSILGDEDGFRSPIDLTSRTPSHIRFGDIMPEANQLALIPFVTDQSADRRDLTKRNKAYRSFSRNSIIGGADAHCQQNEKRNSRCS